MRHRNVLSPPLSSHNLDYCYEQQNACQYIKRPLALRQSIDMRQQDCLWDAGDLFPYHVNRKPTGLSLSSSCSFAQWPRRWPRFKNKRTHHSIESYRHIPRQVPPMFLFQYPVEHIYLFLLSLHRALDFLFKICYKEGSFTMLHY